jgi:hypothetical protein
MKRMDLTPAEIAADPRFDGALEHADAYLGEYMYRPVVFSVTRKGKLQWRSVDDAGKVVRQFNWHANVRVWVRATFGWSYKERVRLPPREYGLPSVHLGHQGSIAAGDLVFVHPDGLVRAYPAEGAGAVVYPIGVALASSAADRSVCVQIGSPVAIPETVDASREGTMVARVPDDRRVVMHGVITIPGGE